MTYYTETTTTHYNFDSRLNHPDSWQEPFKDYVNLEIVLILLGDDFTDFIKRVNTELNHVWRYDNLFKISASNDRHRNDQTSDIQYYIKFKTTGDPEGDADVIKFLRTYDPRNNPEWPIRTPEGIKAAENYRAEMKKAEEEREAAYASGVAREEYHNQLVEQMMKRDSKDD